jgi:type VI secretion system secreted protein VgrG
MTETNNLENLESAVGELKSNRCEQRFKLFNDYKQGFGDRFDDLEFLNYKTGGVTKGVELREVQTGCEIYERLGWDSAAHNEEGFHKCGCKPFDEQLRFVSEKGKPLSNTDYLVTLDDGRTMSGTTDNDGKTKRIRSANKERTIEKVEFIASERIQPLCSKNRVKPGTRTKKIKPSGVVTSKVNVGSSVKTVTVKGNARELTPGEIKMCRPIFKDSIYYSEVKIHKGEWLPFDMQPDDTAMSPNGEIFFPTATYQEDFSKAQNPKDKIWFMHEIAHVWQWNRGYRGRLKAMGFLYGLVSWTSKRGTRLVYEYYYPENKYKKLSEFNMEQQAEIISHYFGAKFLNDSKCLSRLTFLERVLTEFMKEPRYVALLPGGTR